MKNEILPGYQLLKTLSKQKFGQSYLCHKTETNTKYVLKKLKAPLTKESLQILDEINLIDSANISKSKYITQNKNAYIIREYFEGTDLKTLLKKSFHKISVNYAVNIYIQLFNILDLLHQRNILHCDIKPSNIIVRTDKSGQLSKKPQVALIDFERAIHFPANANTPQQGFSLLYSPPEHILKYKNLYSPTLDIFSASISLLETITKKRPLYDCNAEVLINLQLTYPIPKPHKFDDELFSILQKGLYKERFPRPPHRLSSDEVNNILQNGINKRSDNAIEMSGLLHDWLIRHPEKKKSWFSKFWQKN